MYDRESAAQSVRAGMTKLVEVMGSMRPFTINGVTFTADVLVTQLVIDPGNLDRAMAEAPAWIAYWGVLSADAKKFHDAKEAAYRQARDSFGIRRRSEGKTTEKALDEEWRTQPEYQRWYEDKAETERAWSCATFVHEAHLRRSQMLSSLGRVYADERANYNPRGPAAGPR